MRYEGILGMIGNTPHIRISSGEAEGSNLFLKIEGYNPTGSIKDRACINMIRAKQREGTLQPSMTLLDASSGNMACALAFFGRIIGHPVTVVVSSKLTLEKRDFLRYFGATIHQVGDFTIEGNRFSRQMVQAEGLDRYCFLDQLHNWENPRAYYNTLGPEVLRDFPDVVMVVGSLGSGGSLLGTGQFLKEKRPGVTVVAVQSATGTRIPGTGSFDDGDYVSPFIQKGFDDRVFDHVVKINEEDALRRTSQLRDQGIFCGLQTGGVLHAAHEIIKERRINGDVVAISGDSGWKNMAKLLLTQNSNSG